MKKLLIPALAAIMSVITAAELSSALPTPTTPAPAVVTEKEVFIEKLNKSLAMEYGAAIQYVQHAAVITGPQYGTIATELKTHAKEEMEHANTLSIIINDLGRTPSVDVEKREVSTDSKTMLEQDLANEEAAIVTYKELIQLANKLMEPGYRHQLESILVQEQEHRRDLLHALGK